MSSDMLAFSKKLEKKFRSAMIKPEQAGGQADCLGKAGEQPRGSQGGRCQMISINGNMLDSRKSQIGT